MDPIPPHIKNLWNTWNLRIFILVSLLLQSFLVLVASFRKRKAQKRISMLVWLSYLLADWVAAFAVGLISNSQGDSSPSRTNLGENDDLLAFWAPFLLLHLGGPDTITAIALEDNELWLRHFAGFLFQLIAVLYVFLQSLAVNDLWIPTVLMFLTGTVKYSERTRALYLASLDRFRASMLKDPDPGPNYAKLMEEYRWKKEAGLPTHIDMEKEPDKIEAKSSADATAVTGELHKDTIEMVEKAHHFFEIFKQLLVDLIFSFHERNESRDFFLHKPAEYVFKVLEIELNFMYDVLYTKAVVVNGRLGYIIRFICFCFLVAALVLFACSWKKEQGVSKLDIRITYTLLVGALVLDSVSLIKLITSDWTLVFLKSRRIKEIVFAVHSKLSGLCGGRWSNTVSQFNLINYFGGESPKWFHLLDKAAEPLGLRGFFDEMRYKSRVPVREDLKKFIFEKLKEKAKIGKDLKTAKQICSGRGDWILGRITVNDSIDWSVGDEVEYDESLLLWHIATELCYPTKDGTIQEGTSPTIQEGTPPTPPTVQEGTPPTIQEETTIDQKRHFCKLMSNYMLYLMVMRPTMMQAAAGIGLIRFRDTCAEAKKFFGRSESESKWDQIRACKVLLSVNTEVKPEAVKGDRSKSVLFDACILAKELNRFKEEEKWTVMSEVWLELMSYAATHCQANGHAQQLSKGGELLTFVWLLMAHLGLGEQFRIQAGHARAKLIVEK